MSRVMILYLWKWFCTKRWGSTWLCPTPCLGPLLLMLSIDRHKPVGTLVLRVFNFGLTNINKTLLQFFMPIHLGSRREGGSLPFSSLSCHIFLRWWKVERFCEVAELEEGMRRRLKVIGESSSSDGGEGTVRHSVQTRNARAMDTRIRLKIPKMMRSAP